MRLDLGSPVPYYQQGVTVRYDRVPDRRGGRDEVGALERVSLDRRHVRG